MLEKFIKTYSGDYKYTSMVRHQGTVLSFAMDANRHIWYTVLDLGGSSQELGSTEQPKSVLDVDAWQQSPTELIFANEIAEVGFGVADQTVLPVFKNGASQPEGEGTPLPPGKPNEYDYFKSTTARFTADAPFQVLSDGRYVYVFRQAISKDHEWMLYIDADGNVLVEKNQSTNCIHLVNSTLLVDRFLLVGNTLTPKMEVRYQRSRSKTRPASRKDSLGVKDLDGNIFYEPTQELKFIANLKDGHFSVLLLPTAIAEVERWQIFAENKITHRMDSYNVERSEDGLFNTRGTQTYTCADHPQIYTRLAGNCSECGNQLVPRIVDRGYAESALEFNGTNSKIEVQGNTDLSFTSAMTVEAWVRPGENIKEGYVIQSESYLLSIKKLDPQKFTFTFSVKVNDDWLIIATDIKAEEDAWYHVAGTMGELAKPDENNFKHALAVYVNGKRMGKTGIQGDSWSMAPSETCIKLGTGFAGVMDDVRLWKRTRSSAEIQSDMHYRLTGLEPNLAAYWRLDEGSGNILHDDTNNGEDGDGTNVVWVTSDAPVGEHPGIERTSFEIVVWVDSKMKERVFKSAPTSLLYYQQSKAASGYSGERKPLKNTGRVMLAVATNNLIGEIKDDKGNLRNHITALDFGVSATGRLAQIPDKVILNQVNAKDLTDQSLNEKLDDVSVLQTELAVLNVRISQLDKSIQRIQLIQNKLAQALENPATLSGEIAGDDLSFLNADVETLKNKMDILSQATFTRADLEYQQSNALAYVYENYDYTGRCLGPFIKDEFVGDEYLNSHQFNEMISSILFDEPLQVVVYEHANRGGKTKVFLESCSRVGVDWNDKISSMDVQENPAFGEKMKNAVAAEAQAQTQFNQAQRVISSDKLSLEHPLSLLKSEKEIKDARRKEVEASLSKIQDVVKDGPFATMPSVCIDKLGLTISGGLLEFAWTQDAPLLFDSATGKLAMYFRGKDDQFFVAYYDTFNERTRIEVPTESTSFVRCFSTSAIYEKITMSIEDGKDPSTCRVKIYWPDAENPKISEVWKDVPRIASDFAKVLNGQATDHTFIGEYILDVEKGGWRLSAPGARRAIDKGAVLMVGDERVILAHQVMPGANFILFEKEPILTVKALKETSSTVKSLPIYHVEYDYFTNASCSEADNSNLLNGSLLIRVPPVDTTVTQVVNTQSITPIQDLCQWKAVAPGSTLVFDGQNQCLEIGPSKEPRDLDTEGDLTLEAWVKPASIESNACVIQHKSAQSNYMLALEKRELKSALNFDGIKDCVVLKEGVMLGSSFTQEAWIKPSIEDNAYHGFLGYHPEEGNSQRPPSIWVYQKNGIHAGFGDGLNWDSFIIEEVLSPNTWNHIASTFDGKTYKLYVNGLVQYQTDDFAGKVPCNTPIRNIGCVDNYFKGAIDEVRIWRRTRTQQEIQADMNRRLYGNEADLVSYWHFENGEAKDYSQYESNAVIEGKPDLTISPLTAYSPVAGVGEKFVKANDIIPAGNWTHIAAAFDQAYGLEFGGGDTLDCGNDATLDINQDLTIEVFLQVGLEKPSITLNQAISSLLPQVIISRGKLNDGEADQQVPYSLCINGKKLEFIFEDINKKAYTYQSTDALSPGYHKVAVSRKRLMEQEDRDTTKKSPNICITAWDEIAFYVDGVKQGLYKYESAQSPSDNFRQPIDVGNSNKPVVIGENFIGKIAEIRVWNTARDHFPSADGKTFVVDPTSICASIQGNEKGLVSWWRLQEGNGNKAFDSKSQNHATIYGAQWVKSPDTQGSNLKLYINGQSKETAEATLSDWKADFNQFVLGGKRLSEHQLTQYFAGELEEVRIWQTTRTEEQIQDDLFRRIRGEKGDLIAYYTFDAETSDQVSDYSLRGNHFIGGWHLFKVEGDLEKIKEELNHNKVSDELLEQFQKHGLPVGTTAKVEIKEDLAKWAVVDVDQTYLILNENQTLNAYKSANHVLSTAPIGEDTPQVRSALAGIRTPFSGKIKSTPAVQEYGDMQYDSRGNLIGVFKRSYSYILDGNWQIITGYKVGDMVTEWIGQVQFAPQVTGFIEGAPPVPGENLTLSEGEYNGASAIELVEADSNTYTFASSRDTGFDMSVDFNLGVGPSMEIYGGLGVETKAFDLDNAIGLKASFEHSLGWLDDASTTFSRSKGRSTSLKLWGRSEMEKNSADLPFKSRFLPDNTGLALVQSETADVFALRLQQNGALISYQMRPNPDIPKDWNIIHFPINPTYIKQGTLDGKMGLLPDVDYPNALAYNQDSSFFKPIEAYALKNRIRREESQIQNYFEQYAAGAIGRRQAALHFSEADLAAGRMLAKFPNLSKYNLINTYVWTADGGLFAETQDVLDSQQEMTGGSYAFTGKAGLYIDFSTAGPGAGMEFALDALFGGHLNLTVTKTQDTSSSFCMNINLDNVERDIYVHNDHGEVITDGGKPIKQPGKVDAYRFMTFYLEPKSDHFDDFFNTVVDPIWLAQSDDPGAVALRDARNDGKKPACWRVIHRVTYVSRVLPPLDLSAPPSLEKTLQTLDIDSNYELIKQMEPYVRDHLTDFADFSQKVDSTINAYLPELAPHRKEVKQYLSLYFGLEEGYQPEPQVEGFGEEVEYGQVSNKPPKVVVGQYPDQLLDCGQITLPLSATIISDDRLKNIEDLFLTWELLPGSGQQAEAVEFFSDLHILHPIINLSKKGVYKLRLTASDGILTGSDDAVIVVNEAPVIESITVGRTERRLEKGEPCWELVLTTMIQGGLGKPETIDTALKMEWKIISGPVAELVIEKPEKSGDDPGTVIVTTKALFHNNGHYLLEFRADNGITSTSQINLEVAAHVTDGLQALYTFGCGQGNTVSDVSGWENPLDLTVSNPAAITWNGGLNTCAPAMLFAGKTQAAAVKRITDAIRKSGEITLEAWIKPEEENEPGLRRILTFSNGPAARNFILAQSGNTYHAGLRTTTNQKTDVNASLKSIAGGVADTHDLSHIVFTRNLKGESYLYINKELVASRIVDGDFTQWDDNFQLALGNEIGAGDKPDRAWAGEYHLIAIYDRALSPEEIIQNYEFGADRDLPPQVYAGEDQTINWSVYGVANTNSNGQLIVKMQGRVTHDRPTLAGTIEWTQVGGPRDCVHFTDANVPATNAYFSKSGSYILRLTASDGTQIVSREVRINITHEVPIVKIRVTDPKLMRISQDVNVVKLAGTDVSLALDGIVQNSQQMQYPAGKLKFTWMSDRELIANTLETDVTFTRNGVYTLTLTATNIDDESLTASDSLIVTVNRPPVVDAGPDQVVILPDGAVLDATVSDDGLPNPPGMLELTWTAEQLNVKIEDPKANYTIARFPAKGVYTLKLSASDCAAITEDKVTVIVNKAPVVDACGKAGVPQKVKANEVVTLSGNITDEGFGHESQRAKITTLWSLSDGPVNAKPVIKNATDLNKATVQFPQRGNYVLLLTANNTYAEGRDTVTFTVHA
jgi:hypothetical protein